MSSERRRRDQARVHEWRELLREAPCGQPKLETLENSWRLLETLYGVDISREDRVFPARDLLTTFFNWVDLGYYPPPELLLALRDAYDEYLYCAGAVTLEEVFFGKPKKRAGNRARRYDDAKRKGAIAWVLGNARRNGLTWTKAAEEAKERLGLNDDVDSLARFGRKLKQRTRVLKEK